LAQVGKTIDNELELLVVEEGTLPWFLLAGLLLLLLQRGWSGVSVLVLFVFFDKWRGGRFDAPGCGCSASRGQGGTMVGGSSGGGGGGGEGTRRQKAKGGSATWESTPRRAAAQDGEQHDKREELLAGPGLAHS